MNVKCGPLLYIVFLVFCDFSSRCVFCLLANSMAAFSFYFRICNRNLVHVYTKSYPLQKYDEIRGEVVHHYCTYCFYLWSNANKCETNIVCFLYLSLEWFCFMAFLGYVFLSHIFPSLEIYVSSSLTPILVSFLIMAI